MPSVLSRDQAQCECETEHRAQPSAVLCDANAAGTRDKSQQRFKVDVQPCCKVERSPRRLLNALARTTALRPNTRAFGDFLLPSSCGQADPPKMENSRGLSRVSHKRFLITLRARSRSRLRSRRRSSPWRRGKCRRRCCRGRSSRRGCRGRRGTPTAGGYVVHTQA